MSVIIPNAQILSWSDGRLIVEFPAAFRNAAGDIITRCWKKHHNYAKVGIDIPFRPRSSRAQGKLHALLTALAPILEMTFDECKLFVKMEATELGYPMVQKIRFKGTKREYTVSEPQSEADASTAQEHMLIITAEKLGAEAGHDLEAEYDLRMKGM